MEGRRNLRETAGNGDGMGDQVEGGRERDVDGVGGNIVEERGKG